ncbi:unnamed protein product [Blepharisma stoltei]|uniref:Non-specific serine/threonine protein kinase n=1 Tax=Blepharisma stoltei TaxID=1481888 RepID=A0AAU9K1W4_9CILI|nr:unnamed protein product [Blepharisma stoltei]
MKITIKFGDRVFELNVEPNTKVKDLKDEVARLTLVPPHLQKLSLISSGAKVLLPTSSKISLFNVHNGTEIFLEAKETENPIAPQPTQDDRKAVRSRTAQPVFNPAPVAHVQERGSLTPSSVEKIIEHEEIESPSVEYEPWLTQCVLACQEGKVRDLFSVLKDYMRKRNMRVLVEDVTEFLNSPHNGKWSCIHFACYMGHANIVKELIELGVNCNIETDDHWTPLQIACYQGHKDCVELLLNQPYIQINKMTAERGTGLHLSSLMGHTEIVRLLLDKRATTKLEDPYGKTALELATNIDIAELIPKYIGEELLEKYGQKNHERPAGFNGEVYSISSWQINDKLVFLVIDTQNGTFIHYNNKNAYLEGIQPDISIPFVDIQEVKSVTSTMSEDKFYFVVSTRDITLKYYTNSKDKSAEWITRLYECINFFHLYIHRPENREWLENQEENRIPIQMASFEHRESFEEEAVEYNEGRHINEDSFDVVEEIGSGSFGHVYKVIKKDNQEIYALKVLNKTMLKSQKQLKYAIAECKILKSIRHPFIIPIYWAFQTNRHLFMTLEYCPNGDLSLILEHAHYLSTEISKFYIAETILAIEHLHSMDIVYRDLKPQNILVDEFGHIRLADFGLAKENVTESNPAMSFCGSPAYLPPELLAQTGAWKPADVYCIGANLYEMLVGQPPFYTENITVLYQRISKSRIKFPEGIDPDAKDLINLVMNKNPEERPSIQQVKQHSFFRDINWDDLFAKKIEPPISQDDFKKLKVLKEKKKQKRQ